MGVSRENTPAAFRRHLFIYLAVNAALIVIDIVEANENYWFYIPLTIWGVFVVIHGLQVYLFGSTPEDE